MRRIVTPDGLFIYDRSAGTCLFTPDVRSEKWVKPLYAQIALTNKCNKSCWFCYNRSSPEGGLEWEPGALKRLIGFLDRWGIFGVSFGGGEPFLYPHLNEIVRYAWNETGLDVSLTTNGTEGEVAKIDGFVSEVRVSVYDEGSLANLKKFIGRRFEVGVNLLLFRGGAKRLEKLIEGAMGMGVSDFLVNSFLAVGRGEEYAEMEPQAQDYAELAEIIRAHPEATFKVSSRTAEALKDIGGIDRFLPFNRESNGRIIAITADGKVKASSLSEEGYAFSEPEEIPKLYRILAGI